MDKTIIIQNVVDTLITMFHSNSFPEQIATTIIKREEGDTIPADSWSFANRLLMAAQGTQDARGYKQWQEVGRYVKKGSKAIHIFAPLTKKIKEKDESTGEETEKIFLVGFRPVCVFRYEDTEGEPLADINYRPKTFPPFFDVAKKLGLIVEYQPLRGNYLGRYTSSTETIELCSSDAHVYYHELSHAVARQNKFPSHTGNDKNAAEIVAEFSSCVLCELSGISGYQFQGYEYIKHYCGTSDKPETILKKIMGLLNDVEKIVSIVLNATEDKLPAQG